jgi:hypothetical protein
VSIGRRQEPVAADAFDAVVTAAGETRLPFDVVQRGGHRGLVRGQQRRRSVLFGDGEKHADALGRREGQVKRRDPRTAVRGLELLPGPRIAAGHRSHERRPVHVAGRSDKYCAAPGPTARCLAATGEVILQALGHLLLVIAELVR